MQQLLEAVGRYVLGVEQHQCSLLFASLSFKGLDLVAQSCELGLIMRAGCRMTGHDGGDTCERLVRCCASALHRQ